ncbi:MAG: hypothetical protein FWF34_00100 [Alphaproteobacteria bacterium]|nr:hypothetical protein [Alphaproteobacteria bacterium]MCL2889651.1 hypothetical protein [Alphaproteobacteria bacterium]
MQKLILIICVLFVSACARPMEVRLDNIRSDFVAGDFSNQSVGDKNLDPLLAGNALFQQDKFAESDRAFEDINRRMNDAQSGGFFHEAANLLGGQMTNSYRPYFMDALFVSYYQIWAALAENRMADARVLVNQSYARQQELSREYASLIARRQRDDSGLAASLRNENSQWESFSDIMNPALTYLAGIYFLNIAQTNSEWEDARIYLARTNGMMPRNEFVRADLTAAQNRRTPDGIAWVFIESGFAPKLVERRIDWPMFIGNGIRTVSIAVTDVLMMTAPHGIDGAQLIANVDAMFMTEYKEYSVNEALRALAAVVSRQVMQSVANNQLGPWGGLAATVYSIATTTADVRTWATLPKHIHVIRIDKTKGNNDNLIQVSSGGRVVSEARVPKAGNHLIYIRWFGSATEPKIINLK